MVLVVHVWVYGACVGVWLCGGSGACVVVWCFWCMCGCVVLVVHVWLGGACGACVVVWCLWCMCCACGACGACVVFVVLVWCVWCKCGACVVFVVHVWVCICTKPPQTSWKLPTKIVRHEITCSDSFFGYISFLKSPLWRLFGYFSFEITPQDIYLATFVLRSPLIMLSVHI